jgi:hypothetical protein
MEAAGTPTPALAARGVAPDLGQPQANANNTRPVLFLASALAS